MTNEMIDIIEDQMISKSEMADRYLTFWTDSQLFGIPIADVEQIVQMQEIIPIPEYPIYSKGVMNLRGSVIPVIDVRIRLEREEVPYDDHTCIIVTAIGEIYVGLIVDSVKEVTRITADLIVQPPEISHEVSSGFLSGIGKTDAEVILLLDPAKLINQKSVC